MMKSAVRTLAAVAALTLGAATAQAESRTWNVCGGNAFNTCASVALTVTGQNVQVRIWNLSGFYGTTASTVFTGVGFEGIGNNVSVLSSPTPTMTGPARPGDTPAAWALRDDRQIGGGVNLDIVGNTNNVNNSIASGCATAAELPNGSNDLWMNACSSPTGNAADWITITFSISGTWDVNNTYLLVKGQNGLNGNSTQCITGGANENCYDIPNNVVPEPVTIVLLGSGLMGMGGVGMFRRRKKGEIA